LACERGEVETGKGGVADFGVGRVRSEATLMSENISEIVDSLIDESRTA
jgi:hypothetical protein